MWSGTLTPAARGDLLAGKRAAAKGADRADVRVRPGAARSRTTHRGRCGGCRAEPGDRHPHRSVVSVPAPGPVPRAALPRLSLVLQRHGLNLLMGPDLTPCPDTGRIPRGWTSLCVRRCGRSTTSTTPRWPRRVCAPWAPRSRPPWPTATSRCGPVRLRGHLFQHRGGGPFGPVRWLVGPLGAPAGLHLPGRITHRAAAGRQNRPAAVHHGGAARYRPRLPPGRRREPPAAGGILGQLSRAA